MPPAVALGTGAALDAGSKLIVDELGRSQESDISPNGVAKISKREWTLAEYQTWFENLPTIRTPANTPADIYEHIHTGPLNYTVSGGGTKFNADGIAGQTVLEAKFVIDPERSLFIKDSKLPPFLRREMEAKGIRSEFERLNKILHDDNNPLTSVRIIANDQRAMPYLEELMREYGVPGEVVIESATEMAP